MNLLKQKYHQLNVLGLIPNNIPIPSLSDRLFGYLFWRSFYKQRAKDLKIHLTNHPTKIHGSDAYITDVQQLDRDIFVLKVSVSDSSKLLDIHKDCNMAYYINRFALSYFYLCIHDTKTNRFMADAYTPYGLVEAFDTDTAQAAEQFIQNDFKRYRKKRGFFYYHFWRLVARLNRIDFYAKEKLLDNSGMFQKVLVEVIKEGLENDKTREQMLNIIEEVSNKGDLPKERILEEFKQQNTPN